MKTYTRAYEMIQLDENTEFERCRKGEFCKMTSEQRESVEAQVKQKVGNFEEMFVSPRGVVFVVSQQEVYKAGRIDGDSEFFN